MAESVVIAAGVLAPSLFGRAVKMSAQLSPKLELATALLPFACMGRPDGIIERYDPQVIVRFEATAGEIQVAYEMIRKHFPALFAGDGGSGG